jgi:hypothetical protein
MKFFKGFREGVKFQAAKVDERLGNTTKVV